VIEVAVLRPVSVADSDEVAVLRPVSGGDR
jgi:molybdopterin converting factor small subunit